MVVVVLISTVKALLEIQILNIIYSPP